MHILDLRKIIWIRNPTKLVEAKFRAWARIRVRLMGMGVVTRRDCD